MTSEMERSNFEKLAEAQQNEVATTWRSSPDGEASSILLPLIVNFLDVYILPAIVVIGIISNLTSIAVYMTTARVRLKV